MSRLRRLVSDYPELLTVLVAAAIGLTVQTPLAWLASRQGINALLIVLVFSTAVTIEPLALRRVSAWWRPLLVTLLVGATALLRPVLARLPSRGVGLAPRRRAVRRGWAPCEIASVATTAMAKGEAALSAGGVLIGSTIITVAIAGPVLALEAGHASRTPPHTSSSTLSWSWPCRSPSAWLWERPDHCRTGPRRTAPHRGHRERRRARGARPPPRSTFTLGYLAVAGALLLFPDRGPSRWAGSSVGGLLLRWRRPSC